MASPPLATRLETQDIQGLVLRGFGPLPEARFLLLQIKPNSASAARRYLRALADRLNKGSESPGHLKLDIVLQVALAAPGLEKLEVPEKARATFQREFLEGMHDSVRAISLGDEGENNPKKWEWGHGEIDALLMVYAKTATTLEAQLDIERAAMADGFVVLHEKTTIALEDNKEHFGWRDGLSLPVVGGVPDDRPRTRKHPVETWTKDPIEPGEFVLGYCNEYKCLTESPTVEPAEDPADLLPPITDGKKDLGKNGTYLVYREMTQDVHGLWDYLARESREPGDDVPARAIALGAKMVGRWPSGVPLMNSPTTDAGNPEANAFTYESDKVGVSCPLGSHIRRANPRDVLALDRSHDDSIEMVRKHQMIRRGRAFGPPVAKSMDPREILATPKDTERRGLHFICIVGHISRQFEFVQRAWIHSANFASLFNDSDPLTAARHTEPPVNNQFTCPATPVRRRYKDLPPFTRLLGGAYFFLPSITALRFIAQDR